MALGADTLDMDSQFVKSVHFSQCNIANVELLQHRSVICLALDSQPKLGEVSQSLKLSTLLKTSS